jgi:hypothetical protein
MVWDCDEEGLIVWFATSQREAADLVMIEIDLATHQAVRPCRTDTEGLPEHANVTFFGGASNEHDMASKRTLRIECEVTGHAASCWRGFVSIRGLMEPLICGVIEPVQSGVFVVSNS